MISAHKDYNDEYFSIQIKGLLSIGGYYSSNTDLIEIIFSGNKIGDKYVMYNGEDSFIKVTKFDTAKSIVSGTFKCKLKGENSQEIKTFDNGLFDIIYE